MGDEELIQDEQDNISSQQSPIKEESLIWLYRTIIENKRHYDSIAWAITAVCVPAALYMVKAAFQLTPYRFHQLQYGLGFAGIFILLFWLITYDRIVKAGRLDKETLMKIEKRFGVDIKPTSHHERNMNRLLSLKKFSGFGDISSTWFLRWLLFYSYVMCWFIVWNFSKFEGLSIAVFFSVPVLWLFVLNLVDLTEAKTTAIKKIKTPTVIDRFLKPISEIIWENKRLAIISHSIIWIILWALVLNPQGISLIAVMKAFGALIKKLTAALLTK
jgi:hypothetical protein